MNEAGSNRVHASSAPTEAVCQPGGYETVYRFTVLWHAVQPTGPPDASVGSPPPPPPPVPAGAVVVAAGVDTVSGVGSAGLQAVAPAAAASRVRTATTWRVTVENGRRIGSPWQRFAAL